MTVKVEFKGKTFDEIPLPFEFCGEEFETTYGGLQDLRAFLADMAELDLDDEQVKQQLRKHYSKCS